VIAAVETGAATRPHAGTASLAYLTARATADRPDDVTGPQVHLIYALAPTASTSSSTWTAPPFDNDVNAVRLDAQLAQNALGVIGVVSELRLVPQQPIPDRVKQEQNKISCLNADRRKETEMSSAGPPVEVPPEIVEYLSGQRTLTLATVSSSGVPRASTFLYVNDGPTLYFWSRAGTITARHIDQNPVVSFAIDHYSEDLNATQGLQGVGECQVILSGEQIARVADLFGQRFPTLSPGSTMSISFFRIVPTDLQLIDNRAATPVASRGDSNAFGADFHRDRGFSVVANLPTQDAETVTAALQPITATAGQTIVRQGGPADKFLILLEGEAEVIREVDGQTESVSPLKPGTLYGEVAIMLDLPRSASVKARTDVKLLALEKEDFRELVAGSLGLSVDFDEVIRGRLDKLAGA
jgi:CRP-like cAMP-binding protein/uncharacterized protein YhbP (UPF0306 family)